VRSTFFIIIHLFDRSGEVLLIDERRALISGAVLLKLVQGPAGIEDLLEVKFDRRFHPVWVNLDTLIHEGLEVVVEELQEFLPLDQEELVEVDAEFVILVLLHDDPKFPKSVKYKPYLFFFESSMMILW
jgi:hypothetical protein